MQDPDFHHPGFDYDAAPVHYAQHRRTDPRIAAYIHRALGEARTVLNVGAGAGSYEPDDRYVVAVEPSASMRAQRLSAGRVPAIDARADQLPFDDNAFDASMSLLSVHHWPDLPAGLREMRRVTRGPIVIMTYDPDGLDDFWNAHYFPELVAVERARYPKLDTIAAALGGAAEIIRVPIPIDCVDGFQEAFYARPEAFLRAEVRKAQSAWGFLPAGQEAVLVERLATALQNGEWERRFGHYRSAPFFDGALRLVVACQ